MKSYEYLKNTPLSQAVTEFTDALIKAGVSYKTETAETASSLRRVTACAVYAKRCSPHYSASAMDGIALKAEKTFGAAENSPVTLSADDYIPVDTGDPLPEQCDCVIMTEDVIDIKDGTIMLYKAAVPWQNVRKIGEDVCMGDMIAPSFTLMTPALIGAFLAAGVYSFEAVCIPEIAIIPTGDEIVSGDSTSLRDGDIPEFNSAVFSAMLSEWGAKTRIYPIVRDDLQLICEAIKTAASQCDAVIVIAGSSAGRDDYTEAALRSLGTLILHGIAIKPGKPAILGNIGSVPFMGVPGYPVSGIIVMEQIFKKALTLLTRREYEDPPFLEARLSRQAVSSLKYKEYIRCRTGFIGNDAVAVPMDRGAGIVTGFSKASGIFEIDQNSEGMKKGERVNINLLKPVKDLKNSVLIVGSHDPLIDEAADILRITGSGTGVISSHVGSMGGILAIKSGEAHMGGIHLLDTESGEYNIKYVKNCFPDNNAVLIRGVGRIQGLMVRKGNPAGIRDLCDLAEKGLSYVNRQKGSGTRILLDYLLGKSGTGADSIYGYTREEYTHTAVAAAIAAGSADAGLGILSAAKIYDLDFIPLYNEQYDFLMNRQSVDDERVRSFLEVLSGSALRERLEVMGGYTFENIGQIIIAG